MVYFLKKFSSVIYYKNSIYWETLHFSDKILSILFIIILIYELILTCFLELNHKKINSFFIIKKSSNWIGVIEKKLRAFCLKSATFLINQKLLNFFRKSFHLPFILFAETFSKEIFCIICNDNAFKIPYHYLWYQIRN